jgi:hypothetical protein
MTLRSSMDAAFRLRARAVQRPIAVPAVELASPASRSTSVRASWPTACGAHADGWQPMRSVRLYDAAMDAFATPFRAAYDVARKFHGMLEALNSTLGFELGLN